MREYASAWLQDFPVWVHALMGDWGKYVLVFLTGFLVTWLATPVVRWLAVRVGMMDMPDERRIHERPTPRGGGLAIVLGFHAACLVALVPEWPGIQGLLTFESWWHFFLASSVLVAFGLVDDRWGIKPWTKLLGQVIAASMLYFMSNLGFNSLMGFHLHPVLDYALTLFWFLAITNSFNLIDGLDGLATGLAAISATGLALSFLFRRITSDAIVLLGLIGPCLAFLRYNFHPASIFLGDAGSMFLGFALAAISLATGGKSTLVAVVGIPLVAAGVPVFDTLLAIWRRSVRKALKDLFPEKFQHTGIFSPDKEHLHHRFLRDGLTQRHVALILYSVNAAMVLLGLAVLFFKSSSIGIFLIAFVAGIYIMVRHLARVELWDTGLAIISGLKAPAGNTLASLSYPIWDVGCMALALTVAVRMTVSDGPVNALRDAWFMEFPLWLAPTFLALALSKTYSRVWSMGSPRDYLVLVFALLGGLLVALGLVILVHAGTAPFRDFFSRALWFGSISLLALLLGRGGRRAVQEMMINMVHHGPIHSAQIPRRALVYGVNRHSLLLLRELDLLNPAHVGMTRVAGLLDDDPNLRGRHVRGYKVLGNWKDTGDAVLRLRIHQIIVTQELSEEAREEILRIARLYHVRVLEWYYGLQVMPENGPLQSLQRNTIFTVLEAKP